MKKVFIVLALMASLCTQAFAQSEFRERHMAYKGFANFGLGSSFYDGSNSTSFVLTTSHGVQVNPYIFAGAGIGVNLSSSSETSGATVVAPIFGQVRLNFLNRQISPFFDLKGGGTVGDLKGGYLEPSIGVSMPVANKFAIDFSFAYTMYTHKEKYTEWYGYYFANYSNTEILHNIGFKFGFEF